MDPIYHEIITAIYRDRIYAERTLQLGLATGSGDYLAEILVNLDDGTCTYVELIPILEKIAAVDWFLHDEKFIPTEWEPDPDPDAKKSFREWALKAIENLRSNAQSLSSSTHIHRALTSNNPHLIRTTLDLLAAEGNEKDSRFIPILEKIALKDEYKSFFSGLGYQTDCHLRELATRAIQRIIKNNQAEGEQQPPLILDQPQRLTTTSEPQIIDQVVTEKDEKKKNDFFVMSCSICGSLPDDITVNTGRGFHLPDAINKLELKGKTGVFTQLYRCPGCATYYERIDMPQFYGSGNCDEERLVRLSWEQSQEMDKSFQ